MLQNLVDEFKTLGVNTEQEVHESMRSSYGSHYRRMLMPVLDRLEFQSGNALYRPVIDAIQIIKENTPDGKYPETAPPSTGAACQTLPGRGLRPAPMKQ